MGASTRFKHTTCYAYFNDEYRSCLYSLIQLGVIYATQIFFNNPYVSNLGATLWLLTSSRYSPLDLICYIGQWGAFDNWNPFYEFYVSNLGAFLEHYANWTSSISNRLYTPYIYFQQSVFIDPSANLWSYNVSPVK